ncbi:MAG TPA: DUF6655 family protein [Gemmataceae bacterium]|nr:DUF6655 family protein [Gemmataceae bacterium]
MRHSTVHNALFRPCPQRPSRRAWPVRASRLALAGVLGLAIGCGTTRMTDTLRTATEQLLVSNAIDQAVSELDFRELSGKTVYFDPQYLDGVVDRGYLVSSLRQQLLASGCVLQDDRTKASYVVEVRSGGVGTDRHALLVGIPQMNVPTFVPGQPSQIPEIPFAKKTDQEGVAKIAVFAYNRDTGQPVWQSGVVRAVSTSKDTWFLGAGPFQAGSIRQGTEFAGEPIVFPLGGKASPDERAAAREMSVTSEATWLEGLAPKPDSKRLAQLLGAVPLSERPRANDAEPVAFPISARGAESSQPVSSPPPGPPAAKVTAAAPMNLTLLPFVALPAPVLPETEPSKIMTSAGGFQQAPLIETEPSTVLDTSAGFKAPN